MPNNSPQRRTQFSSCDACRRSRVACDASKHGHRPGKIRWAGSCSRCSIRNRPCTFEWISNVKRKPSNTRQDMTSPSQSSTTETDPLVSCTSHGQAISVAESEQSNDLTATRSSRRNANADVGIDLSGSNICSIESTNSQVECAEGFLTRWSDQIFHHGFDTVFGLLVGRNGCPFVNDPTSDVFIPSTKLFKKLDADMGNELDCQRSGPESEVRERRRDEDYQIDQSLRRTIRCFVARWLPLAPQNQIETGQIEETVRDSWRSARKDMLKVINRISYRSALTLYLFSQTPFPIGISEDEESDGISGLVCIQTALMHIQKLRERQQRHQSGVSEMSAVAGAIASSRPSPSFTQAYLDFESRAYWVAVIWDTSSSLTSNLRTLLTSGLNGACSEPTWRLVKTFLLGSFHPDTEDWRTNGLEVSDEGASRIIAAASVCKLYVWKNITSLKEALREGVDEETILFVWNAIVDAIDIFKTSIRPLLNHCGRQLYFLDQVSQLGWYEVSLQYYLGVLVLANTLEAAGRSDLLSQITKSRQDAEHETVNALKFGLENTYTLRGPGEDSSTTSAFDTTTSSPGCHITVSFIAIDPFPHHVVDSVLLMNAAIGRKFCQGKIKHSTYSYLSSILLKALGQLPQSSKVVQAAQESLQRSLHHEQLH